MGLFTKAQLATRWNVSQRTIDRRRNQGLIPWIDLTAGIGMRPQVRFKIEDIEEYELRVRQNNEKSGTGS